MWKEILPFDHATTSVESAESIMSYNFLVKDDPEENGDDMSSLSSLS